MQTICKLTLYVGNLKIWKQLHDGIRRMHFVISFLMAPNYAAMRSKKKNMTDSFWHCGDSLKPIGF